MPILVYKCKKCDKKFETLVLDKSEKTSCPSCRGVDLEKQPTTFNLKGCSSGLSMNDFNPPPCAGNCPSGGSCGL